MNPKEMAEAGFYYTRYGDLVRCTFCKTAVVYWKIGDNPFRKYREQNRDCDFSREPFSTVPDTPVTYRCGYKH
jgi:hypothetical protein